MCFIWNVSFLLFILQYSSPQLGSLTPWCKLCSSNCTAIVLLQTVDRRSVGFSYTRPGSSMTSVLSRFQHNLTEYGGGHARLATCWILFSRDWHFYVILCISIRGMLQNEHSRCHVNGQLLFVLGCVPNCKPINDIIILGWHTKRLIGELPLSIRLTSITPEYLSLCAIMFAMSGLFMGPHFD